MNIDERLKSIKKLQFYSEEDLQKLLTTLPYYMEQFANEAEDIRYKLDNQSAIVKETRAKVRQEAIKMKERKELTSATDRDAWVDLNPELKDEEQKERDLKHEYNIKMIAWQRLVDQFVAVRKFAGMLNDTNNYLGQSQKFVRSDE